MPAFTPTAPAVPAGTFTALAYFRAATTGRACTVTINWLQSNGTPSAIKPTSTSAATNDNTTGWTQAAVTDTAPSDATQATVTVTVTAAAGSEVHYVDCAGLFPGAVTVWTRGGLVGLTTATVTRSDGLYVRGASANNPAAVPAPGQQLTIEDFEAVPGVAYTYTAKISADVGVTVASAASAPTGNATITSTGWWYFDPTDTSGAVELATLGFQPTRVEFSAAHKPIGATYLTVLTDTVSGTDGTITIRTLNAAQWATLNTLTGLQKVLAVSSPYGDLYYGRLGFMPGGMSSGQGNQVHTGELAPSTAASPVRDTTLQFIAQPRPAV